MRNFFHKYSSKIILYVLSFSIFISCIKKHKFDTNAKQLPENKMIAVMTDVFIMEAYVNDKMTGINVDSVTAVKKSFYAPILRHHKVDSTDFYATFNYYQAHPKEFISLLSLVDSNMNKIKALDTTQAKPMVVPPANIDQLNSFKEQEAAMRDAYLKENRELRRGKNKKQDKVN